MLNTDLLKRTLNEVEDVKPIGKMNGKDVYSFDDAVKIAKYEKTVEKASGKKDVSLIERKTRNGGLGYTRTHTRAIAVSEAALYDNRFRKNTEDDVTTYDVVLDKIALKQQESGNIYTDSIIAYTIGYKNGVGKSKLPVLKEKKTITGMEFVNEFRGKLSNKAITSVIQSIYESGKAEATVSDSELEF